MVYSIYTDIYSSILYEYNLSRKTGHYTGRYFEYFEEDSSYFEIMDVNIKLECTISIDMYNYLVKKVYQ